MGGELVQSTELKHGIEKYMNEYVQLWDFYGVIQVIRKEETLFEQAYGYASIEFDRPNDMHTRFSLASVSKQFTAYAIMMLHEQKLLDIDQCAQLYLPSDIHIDDSITIHHLLSHTSGLYNFYTFDDSFFGEYNRMNYSRNDFIHQYIHKQPIAPPGTVYDYNNTNYHLLAWIIEHVSQEYYDDYIRKSIFQPLHMTHSVVDDGSTPIRNKSSNYAMDFDKTIMAPYYNEKFSIGAGGIISNCEDLYKWYCCLRDQKLLKKETYARFFSVNKNNYCYGLEHHNIYGTNRYSHGGDHLGISTFIQSYFDEDISIIILSNNESMNQYRVGHAISDIIHGVDVEPPTKHKEQPILEHKLEKYCGTYIKNKIEVAYIDGKLYFKRFASNMHIELYPVGGSSFARRYYDQLHPYEFKENENGEMTFLGYIRVSN